MFKEYIAYLKDNPRGYWFKARLYGWGWVPVKWQGWLVVAFGVAIAVAGIYVGDIDDAPGAALIGILLMIAILFAFGYWKGEKPRWQWGLSKDVRSSIYQCPECRLKYKEKEWADKCEAWCRDNHSCNLEITAHAEK